MQFIDTELKYGKYNLNLKVNHFDGTLSLVHRFFTWNTSYKSVFDIIRYSEHMEPKDVVDMFASIVIQNHVELDNELENLCFSLHKRYSYNNFIK